MAHLMQKNKVYEWIGKYYLIPNNSEDVYLIGKNPPIKYLPDMSKSTILYYGTLVSKDFSFK